MNNLTRFLAGQADLAVVDGRADTAGLPGHGGDHRLRGKGGEGGGHGTPAQRHSDSFNDDLAGPAVRGCRGTVRRTYTRPRLTT
ncbi:hypothetical protein GCM10011578_077350 [Streptomyces fuscichromogenes]|uniref:Uncharacterized protein n=1 Tax=Streptomyces fuscichromogenes TaxID=1324013 RepID=A0A917XKP0_9ACTN|nr:hypothetical protein GCM10011578_077350 [Streptomyces fuscichromogenes]